MSILKSDSVSVSHIIICKGVSVILQVLEFTFFFSFLQWKSQRASCGTYGEWSLCRESETEQILRSPFYLSWRGLSLLDDW